MKYFVQNDDFVNNDEAAFADNTIAPTDYDDSFAKVGAEVTPLRWGRFVTSVTRTVSDPVEYEEGMAVVLIDRTIIGVLRIKAVTGTGDTVTITKNFQDKSAKKVIFKRVARDTKKFWLNWMPVATSLVVGGTNPAPAGKEIRVTQVELSAGDFHEVVTDPLATLLRYRWLKMFTGGKADVPTWALGTQITVKVTVESESDEEDLVALRHGFGRGAGHFKRTRMTKISESGPVSGFYTRVYEAQVTMRLHPGAFHVGVDAITSETLFDDVAPYSASWWGIPYRVF